MQMDSDAVAHWRRRRLAGTLVSTRAECVAFVRRVRLCYPFTAGPGGIPALVSVLGPHREGQRGAGSWRWKDEMHEAGEAFYGRLLGGKPLLVDSDLLPAAFSASGRTDDDPSDLAAARAEGSLSPLAERVVRRLLEAGPAPMRVLRRELLGPGGSKGSLDRTLDELQSRCFVALQIDPEAHFGVAHRWDLFTRRFPAVVSAAATIPARAGAATLLRHYLAVAGAATREEMRRLFPWPESLLSAALSRLAAAGEAVTADLAHGPGYATPALHITG